MSAKGGKRTRRQRVPFVTKSRIKDHQNFEYNFLQLKCQQQTLQPQMPNVLGRSVYTAGHRQHEYSFLPHKPLAPRSLLEREEAMLFVLAESCTPDTGVSCAHPLQQRGAHPIAALLLRLHIPLPCQQETRIQYGLIFLIKWYEQPPPDIVQLHFLRLSDLWSRGFPSAG